MILRRFRAAHDPVENVLVGNVQHALELGQPPVIERREVRLGERPHEQVQLPEPAPACPEEQFAAAGVDVAHGFSIGRYRARWNAAWLPPIICRNGAGGWRMTSFEYFTVLLSFVVSLGVANLLQTIVRLIQERDRVHFSLAYALWVAAIFNLQVTYWLKAWTYHDRFALRTETSIPPRSSPDPPRSTTTTITSRSSTTRRCLPRASRAARP